MTKRKVYFRADASADIGYGHFIRSLALADMLKDDFECIFFTVSPSSYQVEEMKKVCSFISLNPETKFEDFLNYLQGNEIVVLDNYFFTTEYQHQIRSKGCRLFSIIDQPDKHYVSDFVINHALGADIADYELEPYTQACFGLDYALIRAPFLSRSQEANNDSKNLFICFGGADVKDITWKCLQAAISIPEIDNINVIIGDAYQGKSNMLDLAKVNKRINVYSSISAQKMSELMRSSLVACLPASSVLLEAIFSNLNVIYGYYVDNQTDICRKNGNNPSYKLNYIGDWREATIEQISNSIERVLNHLSVGTTNRIYAVKHNFISLFENAIQVRLANMNDMRLYYEWANDKTVRAMAYNTEPISWENHQSWFRRRLEDKDSCLCIAYVGMDPIGQIRFDKTGDGSYEIDVSVAVDQRGKGYGKRMLKACMEYVHINYGFMTFSAEVKTANIASNAMFAAIGFILQETKDNINYYKFLYNE